MDKIRKGESYFLPIDYGKYRYLLIIKADISGFEKELKRDNKYNKNLFYISFVEKLPQKNEIIKDFIISGVTNYYLRVYPIDANDLRKYEVIEKEFITGAAPDEFMYLYSFLYNISNNCLKKIRKNLSYLGNINYINPENEYVPNKFCNSVEDIDFENIIDKSIRLYENYNLKRNSMFVKENNDVIISNALKERELAKKLHDEFDLNEV